MKTLLALALLTLSTSAFAESKYVRCSGWLNTPTDFAYGSCNNGNCQGQIRGQNLSVWGTCEDGGRFDARAWTMSQYYSFTCPNGYYSGNLYGDNVDFNGTCANGTRFTARVWMPNRYISGSCSPNGSFSTPIYGQNVTVDGYCD